MQIPNRKLLRYVSHLSAFLSGKYMTIYGLELLFTKP